MNAQASAPEPPPPELAAMVELLGEEATIALIERFGGTHLYVSAVELTRIGDVIGIDPAKRMAAEWGGCRIAVPLAKRWLARIYAARGLSYSAIARLLRCNQSSVHRYLKGRQAPEHHHQMSLPHLPRGGMNTGRTRL